MPKKRHNPLGISWFWWAVGGVAAYAYLRPEEARQKLDLLYGKRGHRNVEWRRQASGNFLCVNKSTGQPVDFDCKPWIGPVPGADQLEGWY